ncbi:unnamed protein product [Jaminaea pallidilutea]
MFQAQPQRAHPHQPSVANAASLFGSDSDDPFASITEDGTPAAHSQATVLPAMAEESEPEPAPAPVGGSGSASNAAGGPASPSALFGAGPSKDPDDYWLGAGESAATDAPAPSELQYDSAGATDWYSGQYDQQSQQNDQQRQHAQNQHTPASQGVEQYGSHAGYDSYSSQYDQHPQQSQHSQSHSQPQSQLGYDPHNGYDQYQQSGSEQSQQSYAGQAGYDQQASGWDQQQPDHGYYQQQQSAWDQQTDFSQQQHQYDYQNGGYEYDYSQSQNAQSQLYDWNHTGTGENPVGDGHSDYYNQAGYETQPASGVYGGGQADSGYGGQPSAHNQYNQYDPYAPQQAGADAGATAGSEYGRSPALNGQSQTNQFQSEYSQTGYGHQAGAGQKEGSVSQPSQQSQAPFDHSQQGSLDFSQSSQYDPSGQTQHSGTNSFDWGTEQSYGQYGPEGSTYDQTYNADGIHGAEGYPAEQGLFQPQQSPYQPGQAPSQQQQRGQHQPEQKSYQVQQSPYEAQQSPYQSQQSPYEAQQSPYEPNQAHFQHQQTDAYQPEQITSDASDSLFKPDQGTSHADFATEQPVSQDRVAEDRRASTPKPGRSSTASLDRTSNDYSNTDPPIASDQTSSAQGQTDQDVQSNTPMPPPPKGPARGPPPKGPARGPARAMLPELAKEEPAPPSPSLQLNGFAPQPAADSEDADDFWSHLDEGAQPEEPSTSADDGPESSAAPPTDSREDSNQEGLGLPPVARQPTPKLTLTDEADKTEDLENMSEPGGNIRGAYQDIQSNDEEVDEATREFNELQLAGKSPSARRGQSLDQSMPDQDDYGYADNQLNQYVEESQQPEPAYSWNGKAEPAARDSYDYNAADSTIIERRESYNPEESFAKDGEDVGQDAYFNQGNYQGYGQATGGEGPYAPSAQPYDPYAAPPRQDNFDQGEQNQYATAGSSQNAGQQGGQQDPYRPSDPYGESSYDPYGPPKTSQYGQQGSRGTYEPDPYAPTYNVDASSREVFEGDQPQAAGPYGYDPYGPVSSGQYPNDDDPDTPTATRGQAPRDGPLQYGPPPSGPRHARADSAAGSAYAPSDSGRYAPSDSGGNYFAAKTPSSSFAGQLASPYDPVDKSALSRFNNASDGSGLAAPDAAEERRNARIPLVSFGMDGKLVTFFPRSEGNGGGDDGGYGYGGSSTQSSTVHVHQLSSLISPASLAASFDPVQFPGPAFESTAATSAIARATGAGQGVSAGVKTKKAALIKYLRDTASEVEAGMAYLRKAGSNAGDESQQEAQKTEDRILLMRVLALLLDHDGHVTDNPKFDDAVRSLLTPGSSDARNATFAPGLGIVGAESSDRSKGNVLQRYESTSEHLSQIQEMLLSGQRREAVEYAIEQKLWAHGMIIASAIDQDMWRRVASAFIEFELGSGEGMGDSSLKLAYSLFSGQGPSVIYKGIQSVTAPANATAAKASGSSWRASAALILANRCSGDSSALTAMGDGLHTQGRIEAAHICYLLAPKTAQVGGVDGGLNVRLTLLGALSPLQNSGYMRNLDHFILSEIHEFSHALVPAAKGQEPFAGFPHLQAYRLIHAWQLAEIGETKRAQRYCEAIAGVIKATKHSPYIHRTLVAQVKELSDRLVGGPSLDSGGNWVTRKMQRPTLDGMLSAFEGRFAKFIAGDDDSAGGANAGAGGGSSGAKNAAGAGKSSAGPNVGAFSHYSAITPDAMSGGISRVASFADFSNQGAGMASRPASRAQSAGSHHRRPSLGMSPAAPPPPPPPSAPYGSASNNDPYAPSGGSYDWGRRSETPSAASSTGGYGTGTQTYRQPGYGPYSSQSSSEDNAGAVAPGQGLHQPREAVDGAETEDNLDEKDTTAVQQEDQGPSWGYEASRDTGEAARPHFVSTSEADVGGDANAGFISPMEAYVPSTSAGYTPAANTPQSDSRPWLDEEGDDDLGLGNSTASQREKRETESEDRGVREGGKPSDSGKGAAQAAAADSKPAQKTQPAEEKKPDLKASPSSSWLGRLWGRRDASDGGQAAKAAQAHMGEESAFYFDKELKRWVNKKAGDSGTPAATPPPPPRSTASSPAPSSQSLQQRTVSAPLTRTSSYDGFGAGGGGGRPPPPAALSSLSGRSSAARGTPPIPEADSGEESATTSSPESGPPTGSPPGGPRPSGGPRARSNLGDHSQPPALQPSMRSGSAVGGPPAGPNAAGATPPPSGPGPRAGAGGKKKPLSKRYVQVDM